MFAENNKYLGKLIRLHGAEGEVLLTCENIFPEKIEKTEWVFLSIDGSPVPFFITKFILRNDKSAILKFADYDSAEEIENFIGCEVFIKNSSGKKTKNLSSIIGDEITGYHVIDKNRGDLGILNALLNYQENHLLQVYHGKREILIPLNENLILSIDKHSKIIYVDIPEDLFKLSH